MQSVEAHIYLTLLLADVIESITSQSKSLREKVDSAMPKMRDRCRSAKKRILEIGKILKRRNRESIKEVRNITDKLVDKAIETIANAHQIMDKTEEALGNQIDKSIKNKIEKLDGLIAITDRLSIRPLE